MKFSTSYAIGVAILFTPYATAVPTATKTSSSTSTSASPTSTCKVMKATYDHRPISSTPEDFYLKDLRYENFEVVKSSPDKTYFNSQGTPNMLALKTGNQGVIRVAPNDKLNKSAYFFPGEFFGGCARLDHAGVAKRVNCSVDFATPEIEYGGQQITISAFYGSNNYPQGHQLERGVWGGPSTPYINVTVYDAPPNTFYYLDSLHYSVNCIFCEKDFICS